MLFIFLTNIIKILVRKLFGLCLALVLATGKKDTRTCSKKKDSQDLDKTYYPLK